MKNTAYVLLTTLFFCLLAVAGQADARELVVNLGYGKLQVIDVSTDEVTAEIPIKGWARETMLSTDRQFLYVTASRHMIHKVDLQSMQVVKTVDMHSGGWQRFIYGFENAGDGRTAYINTISRRTENGEAIIGKPAVLRIDLETGQILNSVEVPSGVFNIAYSAAKKRLFAVGLDIYTIDVSEKAMKVVDTYPLFDKKMNVLPIFCPVEENGGVFLVPYYTPQLPGLLSIDTRTAEITTIPLKSEIMAYGAFYSPDRKKAYANMDDLYVIDIETGTVTNSEVVNEGTTFGLVTSADGKKIYLQGGPIVDVYDAATLKVVKKLQLSTDGIMLRRLDL